jgi:hypothetical protein
LPVKLVVKSTVKEVEVPQKRSTVPKRRRSVGRQYIGQKAGKALAIIIFPVWTRCDGQTANILPQIELIVNATMNFLSLLKRRLDQGEGLVLTGSTTDRTWTLLKVVAQHRRVVGAELQSKPPLISCIGSFFSSCK